MLNDFFVKQYVDGHKRYCEGYKSQVARDLFQVGTQHGEQPKGISYGLSSKFLNMIEETPNSTKNLIVVPWMAEDGFDYESTNYDKSTFDADVVDYKISGEEFAAVINDLKRNEYWIPQYTFSRSLCIGMLVVPLIMMAMWAVVITHGMDPKHPILFLLIAITCPTLSLINLLSPFFVYKANLTRLESREKEFETILETWNDRVFNDRKVKWKSGTYGCWLELHFEKDLRGLESFNEELAEIMKDDLQIEYEDLAKKLSINVSGQKIGLDSVGCHRPGIGSGKSSSGRGIGRKGSVQIGHAIPASFKRNEDDDLEIKDVQLGKPLMSDQI
jgi:hypothetical protein